ncbi:FAD-binding oxidoreductase [uncultured Maribacter sp.]|uniref:NAD(P)/FAD-dependent oxidoreductase n=1 Tax=uncultured Maribacter sp. TaxID=431308 RepID=UPI002625EB73|nr:FAD-binding oxidoreductase [uncultured Maribacter sp.]
MVDYLVVGLGLAGISFCEQLQKNNRTFKVVSNNSQTSSIVAGGLYNPVILKRFTLAWNAKEQLELAKPFYAALEKKLQVKLDYKVPVYRKFASIEEQNLWFEAADKIALQPFLSTKIIKNTNNAIEAPFGFGEVLNTGRIDTNTLVKKYAEYLEGLELLEKEVFSFTDLKHTIEGVHYKSIKAKKIVFATGYGLKSNPYFNYLPLNGTKGELLTISAPQLKEENVIKSSVFTIPMGKSLYRVGATYKWKDKTNAPTIEAKEELLKKLDTFLKCSYHVIDHKAGIRPTVADRRPLLGRHPEHNNMFVLNGFGSRGVMIAPYASKVLLNHIEHNASLPKEIDISRFTKKYYTPIA